MIRIKNKQERQNIKAGGSKSYKVAKNGAFYTGTNMSLKGSNMAWVGNKLVSKYEKKGCTTAGRVMMTSAVPANPGIINDLLRAWEYISGAYRDYGAMGLGGALILGSLSAINYKRNEIADSLEIITNTGRAQAPAKSIPNSIYHRKDANGNTISITIYGEDGYQIGTRHESKATEKEGASGASSAGNGSNKDDKNNKDTIPDKAKEVADKVTNNNGSPPKGYKGGKEYKNEPKNGGQKLPEGTKYKEYDVNPYEKGTDRGGERIVIGADGSKWYTNDHYDTFTRFD